jgi:hypothetical protein
MGDLMDGWVDGGWLVGETYIRIFLKANPMQGHQGSQVWQGSEHEGCIEQGP